MKLHTINAAVLALVVLGLVVPTGAVLQDQVWKDQPIVVQSADGPNGKYAETGPNGNLEIDLADAGLNPNARTVIEDVFTISNTGERTRWVWLTHDATERVEFYSDRHGSIVGENRTASLASGETLTVGLRVDTQGVSVGTTLIEELTIHARVPQETQARTPTETETPTPTATVTPTPTQTPNETVTPTPNETETPQPETVEISIDVENATVPSSEVEQTQLEELPEDEIDEPPSAKIDRDRGGQRTEDLRFKGFDVDVLTVTNETVTLSGLNSTVGSAAAIGNGTRPVYIVDLVVPPQYRNSSATIRMRLPRELFNGSDPTKARVGRFVDGRWQLLDTNVVTEGEESVLLEARTPGFAVFALFDRDDVAYAWDPQDKDPTQGVRTNLSYAEPGLKNVTLRLTDARGRVGTDTHRILVNDRPEVRVETDGQVRPNVSSTLVANVTDEVGNVTVDWLFPDGSRATGTHVNHTFPAGVHDVHVTVEDEFGERVERTATIRVTPGSQPGLQVLEFAMGLEGRIAVVALLAAVAFLFARRRVGRSRSR